MRSDFQKKAVSAVVAVIRQLGGEIHFREAGVYGDYLLGEALCSRGAIAVSINEDSYVVSFKIGDVERNLEQPDYDSEDLLIEAVCEKLKEEIQQGPHPYFSAFG